MKIGTSNSKLILLACIYVIAIFLMGSFNIVETVLPYYTKNLSIYNYVKISISLIYLILAFSNIVAIYMLRRYEMVKLLLLGISGYLTYTIASILLNNIGLILAGIFLGFTASIYWLTTRLTIYYEVPKQKLGRAFGMLSCLILISSGVFPYISLTIYHTLKQALTLALLLYIPIIVALIILSGKYSKKKLIENNLISTVSLFKELKDVVKIKGVKLLMILTFSNSYLLPLVVMYSPLISKTSTELADIRLFSYAIPSLASLMGGALYDVLGPKMLLIVLLSSLLIPLINLCPILMIGLLVLIQNIYTPAINAHIGRMLPREYLDKVLSVIGFIGTISTSVNMYVMPTLGQYSDYLTILYVMMLSIMTSIVTLGLIRRSTLSGE